MANDRQKTDKTPQKLPDGVLDEDFATEANNKGVALFNSGQFGLAEHFYHVAYACSPHDNVICENFISILCQQEKYQEAADLGAELYPQFKNNVRFCSFYANALNGTKQYQKALKICETFDGIEQSQDLRVFQFHYGLALYKAGSYRAAEARFFKSNTLKEGKWDYEWLTACFEENGTFAANEKFMVEKLFTNEKSELSPSWRRLSLAQYYFIWSEILAL
jgi:tetratricopeptide (TPR) repeat protein